MAEKWKPVLRELRKGGKITDDQCNGALAFVTTLGNEAQRASIIGGLLDPDADDNERVALVEAILTQGGMVSPLDAAESHCELLVEDTAQRKGRKSSSKLSVNARSYGTCTEVDLEQEQGFHDFYAKLRASTGLVDQSLNTAPAMAGNEMGVYGAFATHQQKAVLQILKAMCVEARFGTGDGNWSTESSADVKIYDANDEVIGLMELKTHWTMVLRKTLAEVLMTDDALCSSGERTAKRAVQQLFGDLIVAERSVGLLNTFNEIWMVRRVAADLIDLKISKVFSPQGQHILLMVYALREMALSEKMPRIKVPDSQTIEDVEEDGNMDNEGLGEDDSDDDHVQPGKKTKIMAVVGPGIITRAQSNKAQSGQSCSLGRGNQLRIWSLKIIELGQLISVGGTGSLYMARLHGAQPAVVKCFKTTSEGEAEMRTELEMYRKVQCLQGKFVPTVLAYGLLDHVFSPFIAMSLEGVSLDLSGITPETSVAAVLALHQLHQQGVLHGDVRLENLVVNWTTGSVKVIDLGRSVVGASGKACAAEVKELEQLLRDRMQG